MLIIYRNIGKLTSTLLFLFFSQISQAQVFKCTHDGKVFYADNKSKCIDPILMEINRTVVVRDEIEESKSAKDTNNQDGDSFHILSTFGSVHAIDGIMSHGEWSDAKPYIASIKMPLGLKEKAELYVKNDAKNLYLAFKFEVPAYISNHSLYIYFSEKLPKKSFEGQDVLGLSLAETIASYSDTVLTGKKECKYNLITRPALCQVDDIEIGGTIDGLGVYNRHKQTAIYEFMHPLKSKDTKHDFEINLDEILGIKLNLQLQPGNANFYKNPPHIYIPKIHEYIKVKIPSN